MDYGKLQEPCFICKAEDDMNEPRGSYKHPINCGWRVRTALERKSINELCKEAHETAKSKGWHDVEQPTPVWLALIHSEVSEALEADRKGDDENFVEELADVLIRTFDLCGLMGLDLEKAVLEKMEHNKTRPHKHGNKRY